RQFPKFHAIPCARGESIYQTLEIIMGLRQSFRFSYDNEEDIRSFLRSLSHSATVDDRIDFFVFSQLPGQPSFTFDCALAPEGLHSERGGEYFSFLGFFIEAVTGQFGCVEVEDL
ncbi:MAG TPA: hypothetical protein PLQ64_07775, partial [Thiobacillaceae bacterium]|nr:hypothetical protein [Thiobacillaceae bacterium]HNH88770.1 hypothetical protein [Thiobacillaceae bacterium]